VSPFSGCIAAFILSSNDTARKVNPRHLLLGLCLTFCRLQTKRIYHVTITIIESVP